eukprot:scaffold2954_cov195-Alexandrium_tamarense.AAC.4
MSHWPLSYDIFFGSIKHTYQEQHQQYQQLSLLAHVSPPKVPHHMFLPLLHSWEVPPQPPQPPPPPPPTSSLLGTTQSYSSTFDTSSSHQHQRQKSRPDPNVVTVWSPETSNILRETIVAIVGAK